MKHQAPTGSGGLPRPNRRTATRRPLLVALGAGTLLLPALAFQQEGLELARETLTKWVETRRLISEEKAAWKIDREMIADRVEVLGSEVETLRRDEAEKRADIERTSQKFVEVQGERDALKAALSGVEEQIATLEQRLRGVLARLPAPLLETEVVAATAQRLPSEGNAAKQSIGERYLTVVGLLNEIDKWNATLHVDSEVIGLSNGTSAEVSTLYIGVGQGYYVSRDGKFAGRGAATEAGWVWTSADQDAAEIARAFEIQSNVLPAAFVRLPIAIQ
jgi:hypothetical protein